MFYWAHWHISGIVKASGMGRRSVGQAILQCKCPQCRQGRLFKSKAYQLKNFMKVHEHCSYCQVQFAKGPRFFEGAMYISYVMNVALFLTSTFVIYNFFGKQPVWVYMTTITVAVILLYPLLFRYSRILYLYAFGSLSYDEYVGTDQNN